MSMLAKLALGSLLASVLVIALVPAARDELHWRVANVRAELQDYDSYLSSWPQGRHAVEAKRLSDEGHWGVAQATETVPGYETYLRMHADGVHAGEAHARIESLRWKIASSAGSEQALEAFLKAYPQSGYAAESQAQLEALRWQAALTTGTVRAIHKYLEAYPNGTFANAAKARERDLRNDPAPFRSAQDDGSPAALRAFVEDYPGHRQLPEAKAILRDMVEGRDIVDLLKERKIEVQATGSGIETVAIRIRRRVHHAVTVRVPVGTYFVSHNANAPNMVTTVETVVKLESEAWQHATVDAACANRPLDIPGDGDRFSVARSPNQRELVQLMPVLAKANASYAVRQAAVWIVTDDADYADLGSLVSSQFPGAFGGTRVIGADEAAQALRICESSGIPVRAKSIWRDRKQLADAVRDPALKQWLLSR